MKEKRKKIYRVTCSNPDCVVVQNYGGAVEAESWPGGWCCPDCEITEIEKESLVHVIAVNPYSEAEDAGQVAAVVFGSRAEAEEKAEQLGSDCYVEYSYVCTGKCSECDVPLCPKRK